MSDLANLSGHHHATLKRLFEHGHVLGWTDALSPLRALGAAEAMHNGK